MKKEQKNETCNPKDVSYFKMTARKAGKNNKPVMLLKCMQQTHQQQLVSVVECHRSWSKILNTHTHNDIHIHNVIGTKQRGCVNNSNTSNSAILCVCLCIFMLLLLVGGVVLLIILHRIFSLYVATYASMCMCSCIVLHTYLCDFVLLRYNGFWPDCWQLMLSFTSLLCCENNTRTHTQQQVTLLRLSGRLQRLNNTHTQNHINYRYVLNRQQQWKRNFNIKVIAQWSKERRYTVVQQDRTNLILEIKTFLC